MPEILVSSVSGSDLAVVGNIIARIAERGLEAGIYPDSVAAQLFDIIKLFDYSVEVADTVTVSVVERLRIYLIKYCIILYLIKLYNTVSQYPAFWRILDLLQYFRSS